MRVERGSQKLERVIVEDYEKDLSLVFQTRLTCRSADAIAAQGHKMLRSVSIACRRLAVVLSVLGMLSSLLATAHVHAADGSSPSSCSACVQHTHKMGVTTTGVTFAPPRIVAHASLCETFSLSAPSLLRARGRSPPALSSSSR